MSNLFIKKEETKASPEAKANLDLDQTTRAGETNQERAARVAIAAQVESDKLAEKTKEEVVDKPLTECFTEFEIEPDSNGVKLVVTRDNEVTIALPIMLPVEAINSVVNAMLVLKKVLHATRGEVNTTYLGIVRR